MLNRMLNGLSELTNVFRNELKRSLTDSGVVLIFVVAVIAYPVLYSIGYMNETVKNVPVAVVDHDQTNYSRQYSQMMDATEQISVTCKPGSLKEAEALFYDDRVSGIILIPDHFEKDILQRKPVVVSVYCDASRFLLYKQVLQGAAVSSGIFSSGIEFRKLMVGGKMPEPAVVQTDPLHSDLFSLYNPSSAYATFIVPGILLIVIQQSLLIGIGLLAGAQNEKRKENGGSLPGSIPGHVIPSILGKASAYVFIYLFTSLFMLGVFYHWMNFPEKGNFLSFYLMLVPYLFTVSFAGLSLGFLFRKRVNALMLVVFISPMVFFFSGVSWPVQSMPLLLRALTYLFPSTAAIPAFIKLRIIGGGIGSIKGEWCLLMSQMVFFFSTACFAFYRLRKL